LIKNSNALIPSGTRARWWHLPRYHPAFCKGRQLVHDQNSQRNCSNHSSLITVDVPGAPTRKKDYTSGCSSGMIFHQWFRPGSHHPRLADSYHGCTRFHPGFSSSR